MKEGAQHNVRTLSGPRVHAIAQHSGSPCKIHERTFPTYLWGEVLYTRIAVLGIHQTAARVLHRCSTRARIAGTSAAARAGATGAARAPAAAKVGTARRPSVDPARSAAHACTAAWLARRHQCSRSRLGPRPGRTSRPVRHARRKQGCAQ